MCCYRTCFFFHVSRDAVHAGKVVHDAVNALVVLAHGVRLLRRIRVREVRKGPEEVGVDAHDEMQSSCLHA